MSRPRKTDKHLPPCVYFKSGAYWLVKKNKWTRLGATLQEALSVYAGAFEAHASGMPALIERVYAVHTPKLSASTKSMYRLAANKTKEVFKEFEPGQVKGKHIAALKLAMSETPARANHTLSWLREVFRYAVEWQLVDTNPAAGIRPYPSNKRSRYITDDEFSAIRANAKPLLQLVMDLCYLTGQRVGDVMAIHRRDLRDEGIYFKAKKTANSTQIQFVVAWTPALREVVDRAKEMNPGVAHLTLLVGKHRKPLTYRTVIGYWWDATKAASVADAHIHDIRAKSATDAKAQGHNAQALLGHGSAAMTERYLRLRETPTVFGPSIRQASKT